MKGTFKTIIAVGGAAVSYLFGGWSSLLSILFTFVVLDYITGFLAAAFEAEEIAIEKDPAMYVHALASVVFGYNQVQDISDIKKLCLLIHVTPEQRCKAALLEVMGEC